MKTSFSFKYNDVLIKSAELCGKETSDGLVYEIDNDVTVTAKVNNISEYNATEWVLYFENKSTKNSGIISEIKDCDTILPLTIPQGPRSGFRPTEDNVRVITMRGAMNASFYYNGKDRQTADEFSVINEYLDKNPSLSVCNITGRSSDGMMPFFDVTANGEGYICAIGWTGSWKADFNKKENGVEIKTGLKETSFYLEGGEKLRTSSILIMKYEKCEDKHNKFRKLMKEHFSYKCDRDSLFANELWGGLPSEEMKKRLNEYKAYGIRFEDIWIDAGWYGRCTKCDEAFSGDWFKYTGEWEVNERVHPGKLYDVADTAEAGGANLMLWFEPERAVESTKIPNEHPEWFLRLPGSDSLLLNYGNKEAFDYIYGVLSHYVKELRLSCYRQDFNIPLDSLFKANETENRVGVLEIKHITGMYALWDKLHEEFPNLLIDNCSSGGRRFDIETLKRSIAFFRSDYQCNFNEDSETLQTHNAGISRYLPLAGCTSKTLGDTYAARSSFSPSWGAAFYNAVFQSMTEEDFKWAKAITDEYRRIRKYMSCNFHNHGAENYDTSSWAIWQYHDDKTDSGIVMAFRRKNSPFDNVTLKLKELCSDKKYIYTNLNDFTESEGSDKLKIELPEKRSSVVFEYKVK